MGFEDEGDDQQPASGPLPPDDRLWRHPSELAAAAEPSPLPAEVGPDPQRRTLALAALASACLTGAVAALALAWLASPAEVATRRTREASSTEGASFGAPTSWPALQAAAAPWLAHVAVQHRTGRSTGSGAWIDADGTLVVPEALVRDVAELEVVDHLGQRHRAEVHAADEATGIAILRVVDAAPTTPMDDPIASVRAGAPVAVIGSPDADVGPGPGTSASQQLFARTFVDALDRRTTLGREVLHGTMLLDGLVDATLVGGLVIDVDGRPVALVLDPDHDDGRALAIPLADALADARELRDAGQVRRPWLGVRASDASAPNPSVDEADGGAVLTRVSAGSPAAAAGLRSGDVVVQIDAQVVGDASDLVLALRGCDPGQEISIEVRRAGEPMMVEAKLAG